MTKLRSLRALLFPGLAALVTTLGGCDKDKAKEDNAPPPPPPSASVATKAGACASGGGELTDPISAPFFPRTAGGYCVDPQSEVKTYGEKGKQSMDEVCTTAFDGECEVYKRFKLKRVVTLHYVDGAGKGGTVEVNLSQFADVAGAYGMYTLRVVAGDPAEPSTPKPLEAGGAGAIGTGRAYVWRGQYLAELQYNNEQESPEQLAKSSDAILRVVAKQMGDKLPGEAALPPSAAMLPTENRIPNGIVFQPTDLYGWNGVGPAAVGFYQEGDKRWRVLSIVKNDADQAKDAFKTIKSRPGSLPVAGQGDEAAHVVVSGAGTGGGSGPKVEGLVARKGRAVVGILDEEFALSGAAGEKARISKDEAIAKLKPLLSKEPPAAGAAAAPSGSAAAPPSSAKPSGSSAPSPSAAPKK